MANKVGLCRRGFLLGVIALGAAGAGCSGRVHSYRYRLIVEVETPEGLRTGSSVIEVLLTEGSGIPNTNLSRSYRGEAAAVDLPNGQTLFALPTAERNVDAFSTFAEAAFYPRMREQKPTLNSLPFEDRIKLLKVQKGRAKLPRYFVLETIDFSIDSFPIFVRFKDLSDPNSIDRVDPHNLERSFGAGYKLRGVYVEMTSDPVGNSIKDRLPWLVNFDGKSVKGVNDGLASRDVMEDLNGQSFSTELFR